MPGSRGLTPPSVGQPQYGDRCSGGEMHQFLHLDVWSVGGLHFSCPGMTQQGSSAPVRWTSGPSGGQGRVPRARLAAPDFSDGS